MGKRKFKICECCHQELPANRDYFKQRYNKETCKEELINMCRNCEERQTITDNWKDEKLKCFMDNYKS